MHSFVRAALTLPVLLSLLGCIVEGRYVIRGTVRAPADDGTPAPVPGATVHADGGRGGGSNPVVTGEDGAFRVEYGFGGVLFPFMSGNSNPDLVVSAPGYATVKAPLKSERAAPGVSRGGCTRCNEGWGTCCSLDAVLQRVSSSPSAR